MMGCPTFFVHCSEIASESSDVLPIATRVSFQVKVNPRNGKLAATNVRVL
jgi:cold shock CspA family protein